MTWESSAVLKLLVFQYQTKTLINFIGLKMYKYLQFNINIEYLDLIISLSTFTSFTLILG